MTTTGSARTLRVSAPLVGLPLLVGAASVLVARSWLPSLPATVATHWDGAGRANGFASASTAVWLPGLGAVVGVVLAALVLPVTHRVGSMRRLTGGLTTAVAAFVSVLALLSLAPQRGIADARDAHLSGLAVLLAVLAAGLGAVLGAALTPGAAPGAARASEPVPAHAPRAVLGDDEDVAWSCWSRVAAGGYVAAALALVPLVVIAVASRGLPLAVAPAFAVLAVLVVSMSSFRVLVGPDGLRVRSVLGWPHFHIPLDEVAEAAVVRLNAFTDFGGWGVRLGRGGRFGVVLRSGPALQVRRGDGMLFVVTLDRPEEAAALLNSLAERARSVRPGGR